MLGRLHGYAVQPLKDLFQFHVLGEVRVKLGVVVALWDCGGCLCTKEGERWSKKEKE